MSTSTLRAWRLTRTSASAPDPAEAVQKAGSFGAAVRNCGTAVLLTTNTEGRGVEQFVLADGRNPERVAGNLGPAVGAKIDGCEAPDLGSTQHVMRLVAKPSDTASRETQAGTNPSAVAEYLARQMPTESWVAVSMRLPKKNEVAATRTWFDHRLGGASTHHTKNSNVLAVSILAGGTEASSIEGLLAGLAATLPGFDIEAKPKKPASRFQVGSGLAAASAVFGAAAWVPQISLQLPALVHVGVTIGFWLLAVAAVLGWAGIIRSPEYRMLTQVWNGQIPAPGRRRYPPRRPHKERTIQTKDADGRMVAKTQAEFGGDYPLAKDVFLVGPSVIVGISSPNSGSGSQAAVTSSREVPPVMRTRIGPLIGVAGATGTVPVFIDQTQRYQDVGAYGLPGSGKALALDTVVHTPQGSTTVGELRVGDQILSPSGDATTVVALHPIESLPAYKVSFSDGQQIVASGNHVWNVATALDRTTRVPAANLRRAEELEALASQVGSLAGMRSKDITVALGYGLPCYLRKFARRKGICATQRGIWPAAELLLAMADEWRHSSGLKRPRGAASPRRLMTTVQMLAVSLRVDGANNLGVLVAGALVAEPRNLPVEPYVMGAWLGDGARSGGKVTSMDAFIVDRIVEAGYPVQGIENPKVTAPSYRFKGLSRDLRSALRARTNKDLTKFIPMEYARASYSQRLALLQGLMDTDGTVDRNGCCELSLSDELLANQALSLIRGLGIKASVSVGAASYRKDGKLVECKDRHRIHFTTALSVFALPRKVERLPGETRETSNWVYVTGVEPVGEREVRCITVDSVDGMFCAADFIPTHNSGLVTTLFAYDLLSRRCDPMFVDDPGAKSAMVVFESKGADGVGVYQRWMALTRTPALIIEVADRETPAIDMLDIPGPAAAKASFFVDAMIFAFGEQSIAYRSANTLKETMTAAILTTGEDLAEAGLKAPMSPLEIASILLTIKGDEPGDRLARALTVRAARLDPDSAEGAELHDAIQRLSSLYGDKVTSSQRRGLVEAPLSKISLLLENGAQWWDPTRPRITFSQVLRNHQVVVVNTGQSTSGATVNQSLTRHLTSMLLFCLQKAVELTCNGWRSRGEAVNIYSDELSLLIGDGKPDTFVWLRNQGRSFGVRMVLATQQPEALPAEVRSVVQSFGTFFWFKQNDTATISAAVNDLNAGGGEWTSSDVTRLPDHHAILRASVDGLRQDPIPVRLLWWGDGGERHFHTDQGFDDPCPGFATAYPGDLSVVSARTVVPVDGPVRGLVPTS